MAEVLARLAGPANVGSGTTTLFTGTAAHTYAIRSIRIVNNGSTTITIKVGVGGVTDALLTIPAIAVGPGEVFEDDSLIVLSGTETIQANATATGLTATICGLDVS